jgi:ubiquinone/menaquinone biosynthesis C-methylase UbiE
MVRLAEEINRDAISDGRLTIRKADAAALPFPDNAFTCAVMTGVIGFISDPLKVFGEVHRTLDRNGRFVVFTSSKELRGTPAAPEPMASRLRFYEDNELEELARLAHFAEVRLEHPSLYEFAQKAGVPESALGLFAGTGGSQLLTARKA